MSALGLVAFHGKAVSMGVEYFGFFPFARQRINSDGEGSPNLTVRPLEPVNTSRVWGCSQATFTRAIQTCRKAGLFNVHDAVVGFHLADTVRLANSAAGSTLGSRSASLQRLPGSSTAVAGGKRTWLGFGLRFDFL